MRDFASVAEQRRAAGRLARADLTTLVRYYVPLVQEYIDAGRRIDAELVERDCDIPRAAGSVNRKTDEIPLPSEQ